MSSGNGHALVIEGLRKSFDKLEVLRGIDLSLAEHEVVHCEQIEALLD